MHRCLGFLYILTASNHSGLFRVMFRVDLQWTVFFVQSAVICVTGAVFLFVWVLFVFFFGFIFYLIDV